MPHQVTIAASGTSFLVEQDESVLDAALRQGIGLPYGCRNGLCGNCKGKVQSGKVHYRQPPTALSVDDEKHGYTLFCHAIPDTDLIIAIPEITTSTELPIKRFPAKVGGITRLSHDVMRICLKLPDAMRMQFLAGQYIDFILKDGRRRSFSIANPPHEDRHIELHVRHIQGGRFTGEVFDHMHVNDIVRIEGPLGSFFLRENSTQPVIFLAGGTGMAPIAGIIQYALKKRLQREFYVYWGVRSAEDLYMHDQVQAWANTHTNIHYVPVLSDPKPEDHWQGRTGYVHEAVLQDFDTLAGYDIYASGPPAMVYAGRDAFLPRGLDPKFYYSDAFEFSND
ncbi:MAG: 2Fe-2S iron-sulfur cluster binding domain-containing protein [Gammaproteobacteria bacterium]|nr:2Fe-2S iron-sulfur cluster binding domain-containing protein [Gammaproteobacteria bacterium]